MLPVRESEYHQFRMRDVDDDLPTVISLGGAFRQPWKRRSSVRTRLRVTFCARTLRARGMAYQQHSWAWAQVAILHDSLPFCTQM